MSLSLLAKVSVGFTLLLKGDHSRSKPSELAQGQQINEDHHLGHQLLSAFVTKLAQGCQEDPVSPVEM